MQNDIKFLFKERQRFNQWYIWTLLLVIFMFPLTLIAIGIPHDDRSGIIIMAIIGLILVLVFFSINLKTEYNRESITINLFPFTGERNIPWSDVESFSIQQYIFVGFGLRIQSKSNTVYYNISGNVGLHLLLKSGETVVIGTRQAEKLSSFLDMISKRMDS